MLCFGLLFSNTLKMTPLWFIVFVPDEDILSSDDDDEERYKNGFVYSIDCDNIGFEDDVDYCDVVRYGEAYARYKSRVLKETKKDDDDDDDKASGDEEGHSDLDDYYSD